MKKTNFYKNRKLRRSSLGLLALAVLLAAALTAAGGLAARAQTTGGYSLTWWTVDSGGGQGASGGGYSLHSTAGQPEAGLVASSEAGYFLESGFWPSAREAWSSYLPAIGKN